jgi:hypothetical protein
VSGPTLEEIRALDGERVRLTGPWPREDQRIVGVVDAGTGDDPAVRVAVETASDGHATAVLRERDRDGVLRAFRGASGGTLVGRVNEVEVLEE